MAVTRLSLGGPLEPTGRYSTLAIAAPGHALTWLSGQVGRDEHGVFAVDLRHQTLDAFESIRHAIVQTGHHLSGIVHLRSYVVAGWPPSDFTRARDEVMNEWYGDEPPPPSTLLVVSGLTDPEALVEIEAIVAGEPGSHPAARG